MKDTKTPDQLKREIAYYAGLLQRTTSRDRQRRAHTAIRKREQLLLEATRVRTRPDRHDEKDLIGALAATG